MPCRVLVTSNEPSSLGTLINTKNTQKAAQKTQKITFIIHFVDNKSDTFEVI